MQPEKQPSKHRVAKLFSSLFSVLLIVAVAGVLWQRQLVIDTMTGYGYQPSSEMAAIRDRLSLTSEGSRYFAASRPVLQDAEPFNASCGQESETNSPIIGCYSAQKIYIYDIDDNRLDGIKETTAAHELLHAAYQRMSSDEKSMIDAEITKVLRTIMTPELQSRLDYYQKAEPGEEMNELHSILGTEFPTLSDALERHYARYFHSRASVIVQFDKYNKKFTEVTDKLTTQLNDINSRTEQANAAIEQYNDDLSALDQSIASFNARASDGGFTTQQQFQSERSTLESKRVALDERKGEITGEITSIEQLTKEREALVNEYQSLSRSINSSLAPAPKL